MRRTRSAHRRRDLLRPRDGSASTRVTNIELFFDLVFVFAVTQLSHTALQHLTWPTMLRTTLLFGAVWWVWIFTSWVTNWLDPDRLPVRALMFALMAAGLVLSTSIPGAFGAHGLVFAGAYVGMQLGRSLFMMAALRHTRTANYRNFQRISIWLAVSGVLWIAGGLAHDHGRLALWAMALGLELAGPPLGFHVPGLGRSSTRDWDVDGGHLAERCSAFILIALGESITVTGSAFYELPWRAVTLVAFAIAFLGTAAMWWIYFNIGAEHGSRRIAQSDDPGALGRIAYTYMHAVLVAGIIIDAVGDELALAHPGEAVRPITGFMLLGGPALYVAGNLAFRRITWNRTPLSAMIGLVLFALLAAAAPFCSQLVLAGAACVVLLLVASWETLSLAPSRERQGSPSSAS